METPQPASSDQARAAPPSRARRILHGIGANLLGKFWVVAAQVVTVPVLLTVWGPKGYGLWLMVSALPAYATISDFGFGTAASIQMTRLVARGQKTEALGVFQSVHLLISGVLVLILAASLIVFAAFPWLARLIGMPPQPPDIAWAFLILMVYMTAVVETGFLQVGYRSTGRYARGTIMYDLATPLETAALLLAAVTTRSLVVCAAAQLAVRGPGFILYYARLRVDEPWLRFGWSHASWKVVKELAKPSLANFALPFATAMSVQGVVFTVGLAFGPAAAGVFGAVRTFARLPLQLVSVFSRASQPELTIAHALTNRPLVARLSALNLATAMAIFAPFLLLSPWGGILMHFVSRGRLAVHPDLYVVMEVVAGIQAMWSTLAMFLLSENKLQKIMPWCVMAGFIAVAAPMALRGYVTLTQLAAVLGSLDLIVLIAAARIWWRESGLIPSDFAQIARSLATQVSNRLSGVPIQ